MHLILREPQFCNVINSSDHPVPPYYYVRPFPGPSSVFQRCAILLMLAQVIESTAGYHSLLKYPEAVQLPQVINGVMKARTERKQGL